MANRPSAVRAEIEEKKSDIDNKLEILEKRFRSAAETASNAISFDHHIETKPWLMVGAAVGIGFLLGRIGGAPSNGHRDSGALSSMTHMLARAVIPTVGAALVRKYMPDEDDLH